MKRALDLDPIDLYMRFQTPGRLNLPKWRQWPMPRFGPWSMVKDPFGRDEHREWV